MATTAVNEELVDVVLVGGGIMSATLATILGELQPDMRFKAFERLDDIALESSKAANNAGTGHAANCELNYTPQKPDGSVDIGKALAINSAFEISLQLWSYLVEKGDLPDAPGLPHQRPAPEHGLGRGQPALPAHPPRAAERPPDVPRHAVSPKTRPGSPSGCR